MGCSPVGLCLRGVVAVLGRVEEVVVWELPSGCCWGVVGVLLSVTPRWCRGAVVGVVVAGG